MASYPEPESAGRKRISQACDNCFRQKHTRDATGVRTGAFLVHTTGKGYEDREGCLLSVSKVTSSCLSAKPKPRFVKFLQLEAVKAQYIKRESLSASDQVFPFFHHAGNINLSDGAILFSSEGQRWVEGLTGETLPADLCSNNPRPWERDPVELDRSLNASPLDKFTLPARAVMQQLTNAYFNSVHSRFWPLPDVVFFQETMDVAYGIRHESRFRVHTAKICVWATWAFISTFPTAFPGRPPMLPASQRIDIMTSIMASINLLQQPNIELLEAITMLVTFHLLSGNVQAGVMSNTVAARHILWLGANTRDCFANACAFISTGYQKFRRDYHLRNLFWICYQQDKELCLRSGQPPALSEYNCDLDLPIGYEQNYNESLRYEPRTNVIFPGDLRLSQIKSKAYIDLYSRRALEKSDALILSGIRQLDVDLEQWRMSITAEYRPTLLFSQETSRKPAPPDIRTLMMRLEYHYCMAYIHQACGRYGTWSRMRDQEIQGVSSSLTLSIAACRSSLYYLLAVGYALAPKDFWYALQMPFRYTKAA
ncbi:hypothetical protein N7532_008234 [Penicillium argentinense]|uniref:Xylanolytic transcriptional activator regulatory domain-containing protein n=1 Tax=Penicillium argentinense TaxID=1131581 RepID=A0A9W9K1N6_9EURO|nr:uncharacterized protein N7532_008234 [Penicillium argentinense]KAJ5089550.1 hypothetical protein N7532_008234 [Penicillium argentinense]